MFYDTIPKTIKYSGSFSIPPVLLSATTRYAYIRKKGVRDRSVLSSTEKIQRYPMRM